MRITFDLFKLLFIPKFTLGIFGIDLGLSSSKGTTSTDTTTDLDKTTTAEEQKTAEEAKTAATIEEQVSTGETTSEATKIAETLKESTSLKTGETATQADTTQATVSSKTAEGIETSTLSLLDDETKAALAQMIGDISAEGLGNEELLGLLESRALDADAAFSGIVDPQVTEARRLQEQQLGQTTQALSRATGGGKGSSSLVAGFNIEGLRAIETSIASLSATLGIDARKAATGEITAAIETGAAEGGASTSAVAALAEVLKGAEQVSETTTAGKEAAVSDVVSAVTETGVSAEGITASEQATAKETVASVESVVQALSSASSTEEMTSIIENLFATEEVVGTEHTVGSGATKSSSMSLGMSGGSGPI